jgi:hypothetical protein
MKQLVMVSVMVLAAACGKSGDGKGNACDATVERFEALRKRPGKTIDDPAVIDKLAAAAKGCDGAVEVIDLAKMGAGTETIGPGLAEALAGCKCEVADLAALEAALK